MCIQLITEFQNNKAKIYRAKNEIDINIEDYNNIFQ